MSALLCVAVVLGWWQLLSVLWCGWVRWEVAFRVRSCFRCCFLAGVVCFLMGCLLLVAFFVVLFLALAWIVVCLLFVGCSLSVSLVGFFGFSFQVWVLFYSFFFCFC